jgi:hypothetical protein
MSFLGVKGLGWGTPSAGTLAVENVRITAARRRAQMTPRKSIMQGLGSIVDELSGLAWGTPSPQTLAMENARINAARYSAAMTPKKSVLQGLADDLDGLLGGLGWGTDSEVTKLVQADKIAIARMGARNASWSLSGLASGGGHSRGWGGADDDEWEGFQGMGGLGITPAPARQGTKAWWQWYATQYLPQYYSQQQIQQYVVTSPYYQYFGSPYSIGSVPPVNVYEQQPYQYNNYPYFGYGSYNPYQYQQYQPPYTSYYGSQGPSNCATQGGYWDYGQNSCNSITGQPPYSSTVYGPTGSPPNVIGTPMWSAVATLNAAGYNIWLLNQDSVSQGVPPGYSQNRVDISVQNGVVTAAAVG